MRIDAAFPGGNIIVERIEGDRVVIRQDLGETEGGWFYWYLRVTGAAGREIEFTFPQGNIIGTRGPAVSLDGGATWAWLGGGEGNPLSFRYAFPKDSVEARFSFGMPYLESHLRAFLAGHAGNRSLEAGTLTRSRKGRPVELLRLGKLDGGPRRRVLLAARHHCCEMMASYAIEGIMETVVADDDDGIWFRERAEVMVVPFAGKDGVEDGDQGKNRRPRDHGRDYAGKSIYPETAALREMIPGWCGGRLDFAMDLHCPWIRGGYSEHAYFVGIDDAGDWGKLSRFSALLEEGRRGPVPYAAAGNLPFGKEWNTKENTVGGATFHEWAAGLVGDGLACSLELPYATAGGAEVNAETARAFGRDLARAIRLLLG